MLNQGYLKKIFQNNAQVYLITDKQEEPNLERYKNQLLVKNMELQSISIYAEQNTQCRMVLLRQALSDTSAEKCGHCDICSESQSPIPDNSKIKISDIDTWLSERLITINAINQHKISQGYAIFDGKIRSPLFIRFMQERAQNSEGFPELLDLIKKALNLLAQQYCISSVIAIPSNTWCSRYNISSFIAKQFNVSLLLDYLYWEKNGYSGA